MNCLIVDAEPQARKLLTTLLASIPGCKVTGVCRNTLEAHETLQTGKADLLFFDSKIPVITGADYIQAIKNQPLVIFTTADEQYPREGYEPNIIDYLPKPVTMPHLLHVVEKAVQLWKERILSPQETQPVDYTFVKQGDQLVKIWFRDIRFVEGTQNYVRIHQADAVLVASITLKAFERVLPPAQFIRVHHSCIAAVSFITAIRNGEATLPGLELPAGLIP